MRRHDTPYDSFQPRTLLPPGEGARHYLDLRCGVFACYISCFPHGRDLYVGWSLWIYMSPLRLLRMKIGRQIQDWSGAATTGTRRSGPITTRVTVAANTPALLEGIDVAIACSIREAERLGGETTSPIS